MTSAIVLGCIAIGLALLQFLLKRRSGLPILGLVVGSVVASLWSSATSEQVSSLSGIDQTVLLFNIITISLILLPAVLLAFAAETTHAHVRRLIGALVFGVLATSLIIEPLGSLIVIDAVGAQVRDLLLSNQSVIIGVAAIVAVFDIMTGKTGSKKFGKR